MNTILPAPDALELVQLLPSPDEITAVVRSRAMGSCCPCCQQVATRIHSRYQRRLLDLPWHGVRMRLDLHVRRFFCETAACRRRIFTERLPAVVAPYARRTVRLDAWFTVVGLALGGEAGARLLRTLGVLSSPDAVLVHIRSTPCPSLPCSRVIGVDDWSYRRGRSFGTIIVDLERHRVIDLLPDRETTTLKVWLSAHPEIQIVSRDRAQGYAEAIHQGAPGALQIADRFHLLQSLTEGLETFFVTHKAQLKTAVSTPQLALIDAIPWLTGRSQATEQYGQERMAPQIERYHQAKAMAARGMRVADIARALQIARPTVYLYLKMPHPPGRRYCANTRTRPLDRFKPYLIHRWNEGIRNASQLGKEIQLQGYVHSFSSVSRFIALLRADSGDRAKFKQVAARALYPEPPVSTRLTTRQAARLFSLPPERLSAKEDAILQRVRQADPIFAQTYADVQWFRTMVRERKGDQFADWCRHVQAHSTGELQRFAANLCKDEAAVVAGLTQVWSQGQVEGQVNRLKLIKRSAYGQMGFATLRQRVLLGHAS
jgi:transposase